MTDGVGIGTTRQESEAQSTLADQGYRDGMNRKGWSSVGTLTRCRIGSLGANQLSADNLGSPGDRKLAGAEPRMPKDIRL